MFFPAYIPTQLSELAKTGTFTACWYCAGVRARLRVGLNPKAGLTPWDLSCVWGVDSSVAFYVQGLSGGGNLGASLKTALPAEIASICEKCKPDLAWGASRLDVDSAACWHANDLYGVRATVRQHSTATWEYEAVVFGHRGFVVLSDVFVQGVASKPFTLLQDFVHNRWDWMFGFWVSRLSYLFDEAPF